MKYYNKKIILNVIARLDIHVPSFDYIILNIPCLIFLYLSNDECDTSKFIIKNKVYDILSEILFSKFKHKINIYTEGKLL